MSVPLTLHTQLETIDNKEHSIGKSNPCNHTRWNGRAIKLGNPALCVLKYGVAPQTILQNSQETVQVLGIGQLDGRLWVEKDSYPLTHVNSHQDLEQQGYRPQPPKKRKREFLIQDTAPMVESLGNLFFKEIGCDIYFQIGEKKIGSHAAFLIGCSKYFEKLLNGYFKEGIPPPNGTPKIISLSEQEFHADEFKMILAYLYTGSIKINAENVIRVATLADRFEITPLMEYCKQGLSQLLKPKEILTCFRSLFNHISLLKPVEECFYHQRNLIFEKDQQTLAQLSKEEVLYLIKKAPTENMRADLFQAALIWLFSRQMEERIVIVIEEMLPLFPKKKEALSQYGKFLSAYIQVSIQRTNFEKSLALAPFCFEIFIIYAEALYCLGEWKNAQEKLHRVLILYPSNLFALMRNADTFRMLGDFETARSKYQEILAIDPANVDALIGYAQILNHLGKKEEAKNQFKKALDVNSDHVTVLVEYAQLLQKEGQFALAQANYQKALALNPENAAARKGCTELEISWSIG